MKTMYLLIMLLPLAFIQPAEAQKLSKEEKAAQPTPQTEVKEETKTEETEVKGEE